LQSAITEAVKEADPKCQGLVGVIVQRETPKAHLDANWSIKGIRFGNQGGTSIGRRPKYVQPRHVAGSAEKPDKLESEVLTLNEPYSWVHPNEER
jgi:hypothetical protein